MDSRYTQEPKQQTSVLRVYTSVVLFWNSAAGKEVGNHVFPIWKWKILGHDTEELYLIRRYGREPSPLREEQFADCNLYSNPFPTHSKKEKNLKFL